MQIPAVSQNPSVSPAEKPGPRPEAAAAAQTAPAKKDTLVLSGQAKDLAATKARKAAKEEMSESLSAKIKEGDAD